MKTKLLQTIITKNHEIHRIPHQNQETRSNLIIPCQNNENHEILKTPSKNLKQKIKFDYSTLE